MRDDHHEHTLVNRYGDRVLDVVKSLHHVMVQICEELRYVAHLD
jgi:hypothetical protein